jgi:hypothetical protein
MTELPYQQAFHKIRSTFFASPDARLTAPQIEGLSGVDRTTCLTVLEDLVRAGFLHHFDGGYGMRATASRPPAASAAADPDQPAWSTGGAGHRGGHPHL